jgi:hypothetical protein
MHQKLNNSGHVWSDMQQGNPFLTQFQGRGFSFCRPGYAGHHQLHLSVSATPSGRLKYGLTLTVSKLLLVQTAELQNGSPSTLPLHTLQEHAG